MNWFELAIEDRRLLVQQASTVSGINAKALEKDRWVTLVLLAVFKTTCASSLHFKGGTSLSKAWQVIDRFSEDIDLSIDRSFYGFAEELSFTQIRKLKRISSEFVSTAFKADLENTLLEMGVPRQVFTVQATPIPPTRKDTVDPQELEIAYVSILENVDYLPNTIKVELSARAIKDASHKTRNKDRLSSVQSTSENGTSTTYYNYKVPLSPNSHHLVLRKQSYVPSSNLVANSLASLSSESSLYNYHNYPTHHTSSIDQQYN
jgi:hypothetical protein